MRQLPHKIFNYMRANSFYEMMPNLFKTLFIFIFLHSFTVNAQENSTAFRMKEYNLEKGIALQGYDAVAYFTQRKSVKGNKSYVFNYAGIMYYFSTQQNVELFKKSPAMYEPQYGGWCAYAMGNTGEKVEVDAETFKIIDNKLYLYYNSYFNNTLKTWNKNEAALKAKADINWKKITNNK